MGSPPSGCRSAQSPMTLPKGIGGHRQSRSISSLPLETLSQLGRLNCDNVTSVGSLSSPAKEKFSVTTSFLGHAKRDLTRKKLASSIDGIELSPARASSNTEDRKSPISFNLFRGHRRARSGSIVTSCKSASESPRAKAVSTGSSPQKDKSTVAKIAASFFHSSRKLERSMSLSRVTQRAAPEVEKKRNHGPLLAAEEVILPENQQEDVLSLRQKPQYNTRRAEVMYGGKRNSYDYLAMDMAEPAIPLTSNASSIQQHVITIPKSLELGEEEAEPNIAVEAPPPDTDDTTTSIYSQVYMINADEILYSSDDDGFVSAEDILSSSSRSLSFSLASNEDAQSCAMSETRFQRPSSASLADLSKSERILLDFAENSETIAVLIDEESAVEVDGNLQSLEVVTEKVTEEKLTEAATRRCNHSREKYDEESDINIQARSPDCLTNSSVSFEAGVEDVHEPQAEHAELKSKLRKRRRSVSASGIGAMLLKVVRVSDSGPAIARRPPKVGPQTISCVDAIRARQYVLEKTAQFSTGLAHEPFSSAKSSPAVLCRSESEDAVKSTYSKFVDIEIDPGGDCVEFMQHSREHSRDPHDSAGFGESPSYETRQRCQIATSERLPGTSPRNMIDQDDTHAEMSTCPAVYEGRIPPAVVEVEKTCLHETLKQAKSNLRRPPSVEKFDTKTHDSGSVSSESAKTDERDGEKPWKKPSSRGRHSDDFNSSPEHLGQAHTIKQGAESKIAAKHVPIHTQEKSRTFVSRLQAPSSGTQSCVDTYRLAPFSSYSVSILSNPSFSSSHQDKLWEEQAEVYSSGGRGLPGRRRDHDKAPNNKAFVLRSPSPRSKMISSSYHHQVNNRSTSSATVSRSSSSPVQPYIASPSDKGRRKKRGRPRTPLRGLMADDTRSKVVSSGSGGRREVAPEGGHFIQQMMSRIRGGSSPKAPSPKSSHSPARAKRRNTWSRCICFSMK